VRQAVDDLVAKGYVSVHRDEGREYRFTLWLDAICAAVQAERGVPEQSPPSTEIEQSNVPESDKVSGGFEQTMNLTLNQPLENQRPTNQPPTPVGGGGVGEREDSLARRPESFPLSDFTLDKRITVAGATQVTVTAHQTFLSRLSRKHSLLRRVDGGWSMINRLPGKCSTCGQQVTEYEGVFVDATPRCAHHHRVERVVVESDQSGRRWVCPAEDSDVALSVRR